MDVIEAITPVIVNPPVVRAPLDPNRAARKRRRQEQEAGEPDEDIEGGNAPIPDPEPEIEEPEGPQPTVNLLGWRRSKPLNQNQLSELREIAEDEGLVNCVKREIFELVKRRLREVKRYKTSIIPSTSGGSQFQKITWLPMRFMRSRFVMAIEEEGQACSRTNMPLRAAIAAKVMCYRTIRKEFDDQEGVAVNTWSCFWFDGYRTVPGTWRNRLPH